MVLLGHLRSFLHWIHKLVKQIPRYYLYGEENTETDPSFVHNRPIFSDIAKQNWKIAPHRHVGLCQVILLEKGPLDATLDGKQIFLTGPSVVFIPSDCVHGFEYSPETVGRIITISEVFLRNIIETTEADSVFNWMSETTVVKLSENRKILPLISAQLDIVQNETGERKSGHNQIVKAAITIVAINIGRVCRNTRSERGNDISASHRVVMRKFQKLVSENYINHWVVRAYCDELGITRKQLGRICEKLVGCSPVAYIHNQLMQEAQRRLSYTNGSVAEIGYDLGFKDPSYFSRFFRNRMGKSPT